MKRFACVCMIVVWGILPTAGFAAEDALIKDEGNRWILTTGAVERVVALEDGKLLLKSLKDRATGREVGRSRHGLRRIRLRLGRCQERRHQQHGSLKLVRADQRQLSQGEQQLDLTVERDGLQVTKAT